MKLDSATLAAMGAHAQPDGSWRLGLRHDSLTLHPIRDEHGVPSKHSTDDGNWMLGGVVVSTLGDIAEGAYLAGLVDGEVGLRTKLRELLGIPSL